MTKDFVKLYAFVFERQLDLTLKCSPSKLQFTAHADLIARFQEASTQVTMYLDGGSNCSCTYRVCRVLDQRHHHHLQKSEDEKRLAE